MTGARDILYGRRGGGWAPENPARELTPEAQAAADRLRRQHAQHPLASSIEPGHAGQARMAEARLVAYGAGALSERDIEALAHVPEPPGVAGLPRLRPATEVAALLAELDLLGADVEPATMADLLDVEELTARLDRSMEEARAARRAGELRRDDGMARAEEHADDDWKEAAKAALRTLAATRPTLTGDDLWLLVPKPAEPRAAGPLWRWAQAEGLIAATGTFVPTTQVTSHASPSRVWKSLTYRED